MYSESVSAERESRRDRNGGNGGSERSRQGGATVEIEKMHTSFEARPRQIPIISCQSCACR